MSLAELAEQAEVAGGGDASTPPGAEADLAEKERAEDPASGPDLLGALARDLRQVVLYVPSTSR